MDISSILGIVIAISGILLGLILEGGSIGQILQPTAALIVFGGTIGATLVSFPLKTFLEAVKGLRQVFFDKRLNPQELINEIAGYAVKARKDGIVSLEAEAHRASDPFLRRALMMAIDGTDSKELRQTMELELAYMEEYGEQAAKVFESAGGYAPTIGIIGAVLGLIQVMQHLDNIEEVGKGIAVAFVATIYGVASANIFFLPAAGKLKAKLKAEIVIKEMILEGVTGIIEGLNPRVIADKLQSFLSVEGKEGKAEQARESRAA